MVRAAADPASPDAEQALATLCRSYWYPLYAYLRRQGHAREDARDLIQAFFVKLLEEGTIGVADPGRGKFRSFLLTALKHFVSNHEREARGETRRGPYADVGGLPGIQHAEGRYARELAPAATPEEVVERRWAFTLLEQVQVVETLGREYREAGHDTLFAHLKGFLGGDAQTVADPADVDGELRRWRTLILSGGM